MGPKVFFRPVRVFWEMRGERNGPAVLGQLAHLLGPLVDLHEGLVVRRRLHRNRVDALSHHEVPDDIRFLSRARPAD